MFHRLITNIDVGVTGSGHDLHKSRLKWCMNIMVFVCRVVIDSVVLFYTIKLVGFGFVLYLMACFTFRYIDDVLCVG